MLERDAARFVGGIAMQHIPVVLVSCALGVVVAGDLEPPDCECDFGVAWAWGARERGLEGRNPAEEEWVGGWECRRLG